MAEITDWRSRTEYGSGSQKSGSVVEKNERSFWDTVFSGFLGGDAPTTDIISATKSADDKQAAVKEDYYNRGVLLTDPNDLGLGGQRGQTGVDVVFDVRDAIITDAAKALLGGTTPYDDRTSYGVDRGQVSTTNRNSVFTDPADDVGRSGRSGGGSGGPIYVGPDRRTIEEYVGDKMIVLTGKKQPELQKIVDAYMRDHKKAAEGASLDPRATVLEQIRNLEEYKTIHKLRPDASAEDTWVSSRQQRVSQLGGSASMAQARGIALAATGANANDIDISKAQNSKGRQDISMMRRLEAVASQIGGSL